MLIGELIANHSSGIPNQSEDGFMFEYLIILEWLSEHVHSCIFKTYQEALRIHQPSYFAGTS